MVVYIPLSKKGKHTGKYETIVSDEDAILAEFNWCVSLKKNSDIIYCYRRPHRKEKSQKLHRVVLERVLGRELAEGEYPDHIDGNGLNNTRENLRLASKVQNMTNAKKRVDNKTGHKGVYWHKSRNKYYAYITHNKKRHGLGYYDSIDDAIQARKLAEKELHKEFARLE